MQPAKRVDNETMPKVDLHKDASKLRSADLIYMKRAETLNIERATKVKRWRKANNILGSALAFGVFGIYFYTMYAVKQETFLDDFNEPEKVIETPVEK